MKNDITIVFILPNFGKGGAERVISILTPEFLKMGYGVKIFLLFGEDVAYQLPETVVIEKLSLSHYGKLVRVLKLRRKIKIEKRNNNKLILVPFLNSILNTVVASKLFLGIPVVTSERSNPYLKGRSFIQRLRYSIPFLFIKKAVFQTIDARNYFFIPQKKTTIIANPINASSYDWEQNINQHILITTCRLHSSKNLTMMVDVVDKLKEKFNDVKLFIYGEGPLKSEIEEYISNKNLKKSVFLSGSTNNVHLQLSTASIFLSTSNYEGISNSILEAMAVGMPMVCTDCPIGGTKMMLDEGCGMISPVGDTNAFVDNIEFIFGHPDEALKMAKRAKEKTKKYSSGNIAHEWVCVFEDFIKK